MSRIAGACILLWFLSAAAYGQTEIERARSSLHGIDRFGVAVDVEAGAGLADHPDLDVRALTASVRARLEAADLEPLTAYDGLTQPYLYVHVNVLDVSGGEGESAVRGLAAFSVEVDFLQPVYLDPGRSVSTSAATWDDSLVGVVSVDRLPLIREAALELVAGFVEDFRRINF